LPRKTLIIGQQAENPGRSKSARDVVRDHASQELIFGVVGPIGSGTSEVAESLLTILSGKGYEAAILKARDVIAEWSISQGIPIPALSKLAETEALQRAGNDMRAQQRDGAAVAAGLVSKIRQRRAQFQGDIIQSGKAIEPSGEKRAYILDSLRHPAEISLLRSIYHEAFCQIGVVCEADTRRARLGTKFEGPAEKDILALMVRDEKADEKLGQQVAETFHLSDFFVDNSSDRFLSIGSEKWPNKAWTVNDELGRLIDILSHSRVIRPRPAETAMYHAYGARMRSACLSRQVGAALMDRNGNLLSTGTNEVPRAGGGVYGSQFVGGNLLDLDPITDHRCAMHGGRCRNTEEQNNIVEELANSLAAVCGSADPRQLLKSGPISRLIEFSRSVHAEMEAILSAARQGISPVGTRLFVTTFPCHNCARHIVGSGVDEVQFIEPYLKSKALPLHGDAITTDPKGWRPPSTISEGDTTTRQVLFRPFVGVAPRLYRIAFYKDREIKDSGTGRLLSQFPSAEGYARHETLVVSYAELEARLSEPLQSGPANEQ
jgi:deoxycytidylate deaminase